MGRGFEPRWGHRCGFISDIRHLVRDLAPHRLSGIFFRSAWQDVSKFHVKQFRDCVEVVERPADLTTELPASVGASSADGFTKLLPCDPFEEHQLVDRDPYSLIWAIGRDETSRPRLFKVLNHDPNYRRICTKRTKKRLTTERT